MRNWTNREMNMLSRYYGNSSNNAIARYLGNRSPIAVKRKAHRLGLRKNMGASRSPWVVISNRGRRRHV